MSAILAYTDASAAYLATDSGTFDLAAGAIVRLGSKVLFLPEVSLLVTTSGPFGGCDLMAAFEDHVSVPAQNVYVDALPRICRHLRERARKERPEQERAGLNNVRVVAALYDRVRGPRVIEVNSEDGFQAGECRGFRQPELPSGVRALVLPDGLPRCREEAAAFFEAARHVVIPRVANGCGVAGFCHTLRVGADGITVDWLVEFPEMVGETPEPSRPGRRFEASGVCAEGDKTPPPAFLPRRAATPERGYSAAA